MWLHCGPSANASEAGLLTKPSVGTTLRRLCALSPGILSAMGIFQQLGDTLINSGDGVPVQN
jgi:hypothetical protein